MDRITFAGSYTRKTGQEVLYITERAVFRLNQDAIALIELAPGIDIERDILPYMEFRPRLDRFSTMPVSVFT